MLDQALLLVHCVLIKASASVAVRFGARPQAFYLIMVYRHSFLDAAALY